MQLIKKTSTTPNRTSPNTVLSIIPRVLVYTERERLAAPWKYLGFRRIASLISVKVGLLSKGTGPELVSMRVIVT
jgi:hypothetical protein